MGFGFIFLVAIKLRFLTFNLYKQKYGDDCIEKITIPASVKKIVYTNTVKFEQYKKQVGNYPYKANFQFEVLNKNLDEASTKCLEKWNADFINIK